MRNKIMISSGMKMLCVFMLLLMPAVFMHAQQTLNSRLQRLMADPLLRTSEVGISVYDLTQGQSVFNWQDKKLYRPASVQKLITSVTALSRLGTEYCFQTELWTDGEVADGVLKGNLYVRGGFDPEFSDKDMDALANMVRENRINRVEGSIVGDVSMKDSLFYGEGWAWDDARYEFQPCLSPLMYNKGCVQVSVRPSQRDSLAHVSVWPESTYYTLVNTARSYDPAQGKLRIGRDWMWQGNELSVSGNVTRTVVRKVPVFDSGQFFLYVFAERLQRLGIVTSTFETGVVPAGARLLGTLSRPLVQVLDRALKKSDNLSAEALFYVLARQHVTDRPVSAADASEVVTDFISGLGYDAERYSIADGSGVSLYNYVSPDLLLGFLVHAYTFREVFDALYEALPIAGVDGTLAGRMKGTLAHRRVRAKTGTVMGVSSLAGYARASNGHLLAFVIINQNVLKGAAARAFQNKVCVELCR